MEVYFLDELRSALKIRIKPDKNPTPIKIDISLKDYLILISTRYSIIGFDERESKGLTGDSLEDNIVFGSIIGRTYNSKSDKTSLEINQKEQRIMSREKIEIVEDSEEELEIMFEEESEYELDNGNEADNEEESEDELEELGRQYNNFQARLAAIDAELQTIQDKLAREITSSDLESLEDQYKVLQDLIPCLLDEVDALNKKIEIAREKYSFVFVIDEMVGSGVSVLRKDFLKTSEIEHLTEDLSEDDNSCKTTNNTPSSDPEMEMIYVDVVGDGSLHLGPDLI